MADVELVLRFFAYRQKHRLHKSGVALFRYLDQYLQYGNTKFSPETLCALESIFERTISLVENVLGEKAFWLLRKRGSRWSWLERPTTAVFDPMMAIFSRHLDDEHALRERCADIQQNLEGFYETNYTVFEGRNVNPTTLLQREEKIEGFIAQAITNP